MKLSDELIKEIAEDLDFGMICYVHQTTHDIKNIPSDLAIEYDDPTVFWTEFEEENINISDYKKIEPMKSWEMFRIMEAFTEQISNPKIKNRLIYALNGRKPMSNFKYAIDEIHGDVRESWFAFKAEQYEKWLRKNYSI